MERRHARRFELDIPVIFRWVDGDRIPCEGAGFSRDISTQGVFVITPSAAPPLASNLEVLVLLPSLDRNAPGIRLRSTGNVVRLEKIREGLGVGIASAFGNFDGSDRPALSLFENTAEVPFPERPSPGHEPV